MGYTDKLKDILRPLGVYTLNSGSGAAELKALGEAVDGAAAVSAGTARECTAQTAESFGLEKYEELFRKSAPCSGLVARRNAIMALLQVNGAAFTIAGINATLSGCGIRAEASEAAAAQTVSVSFPGTRGIPDGIDAMKRIIESILPCQLAVEYAYVFITWSQLEASFPLWTDIETATWDELEKAE